MPPYLAYLAYLRVIRFDATIRASRPSVTSASNTERLTKIERFGFYSELIGRLQNAGLKFESLELQKIHSDLMASNPKETYLARLVGSKILRIWNEADIRAILE